MSTNHIPNSTGQGANRQDIGRGKPLTLDTSFQSGWVNSWRHSISHSQESESPYPGGYSPYSAYTSRQARFGPAGYQHYDDDATPSIIIHPPSGDDRSEVELAHPKRKTRKRNNSYRSSITDDTIDLCPTPSVRSSSGRPDPRIVSAGEASDAAGTSERCLTPEIQQKSPRLPQLHIVRPLQIPTEVGFRDSPFMEDRPEPWSPLSSRPVTSSMGDHAVITRKEAASRDTDCPNSQAHHSNNRPEVPSTAYLKPDDEFGLRPVINASLPDSCPVENPVDASKKVIAEPPVPGRSPEPHTASSKQVLAWDSGQDLSKDMLEGSFSTQQPASDRLEKVITPINSAVLPWKHLVFPQSVSSGSTQTVEYESTISTDFEDALLEPTYDMLRPLVQPLIEKLLSLYFDKNLRTNSAGRIQGHDSGTEPENNSSTPESNSVGRAQNNTGASSGRKRKRQGRAGGNQGNDDEEEENSPPSKRNANGPNGIDEPRYWACPFSKWKPLEYRKCNTHTLKDPSRVKQHLNRNHRLPLYCPVCWTTFKAGGEFASHVQNRGCSPAVGKEPDGVTLEQEAQLTQRVDRKLSKCEQWYSIYAILFPGQPRPNSPFLDGNMSAELMEFEKFMARCGLQVVEETARRQIAPAHVPQQQVLIDFTNMVFQHAIPELLQRFECRNRGDGGDSTYGSASLQTGTYRDNVFQDARAVMEEEHEHQGISYLDSVGPMGGGDGGGGDIIGEPTPMDRTDSRATVDTGTVFVEDGLMCRPPVEQTLYPLASTSLNSQGNAQISSYLVGQQQEELYNIYDLDNSYCWLNTGNN